MEITWVLPAKIQVPNPENPQLTIEKTNPFKGKVVLDIPKYQERLSIIKEMNLKAQDGEMEQDTGLDGAGKLHEIAMKKIKSIDVEHKDSKIVFNSVDSLEYYKEGVELLQQISSCIIQGVSLGKK